MEGAVARAATGLENRGGVTAGGSTPPPSSVAEVKLDEAPGCEPGEVGSSPTGHLWVLWGSQESPPGCQPGDRGFESHQGRCFAGLPPSSNG